MFCLIKVEETKGQDKLSLLMGVLSRSSTASQKLRTLIFCNTIDSCRAVEYAINDETNGGKCKQQIESKITHNWCLIY